MENVPFVTAARMDSGAPLVVKTKSSSVAPAVPRFAAVMRRQTFVAAILVTSCGAMSTWILPSAAVVTSAPLMVSTPGDSVKSRMAPSSSVTAPVCAAPSPRNLPPALTAMGIGAPL